MCCASMSTNAARMKVTSSEEMLDRRFIHGNINSFEMKCLDTEKTVKAEIRRWFYRVK